jgi:hypothetical protein
VANSWTEAKPEPPLEVAPACGEAPEAGGAAAAAEGLELALPTGGALRVVDEGAAAEVTGAGVELSGVLGAGVRFDVQPELPERRAAHGWPAEEDELRET